MKKIIKILICISIFSIFNIGEASYTGDIVDSIRIVGTTPGHTGSGVGNGGKVVFSSGAVGGVYVDTTSLVSTSGATFDTVSGDMTLSGSFWLFETSDTSDHILGWSTFNVSPAASPVTLVNNGDNTFTFDGYAWSNAAGWIFFGNTGVTGGEVIYYRSNNKIEGHAWSQNLGRIQFDFELDTTPTNLNATNVTDPIAANHEKDFEFVEEIELEIDIFYSTSKITHTPYSTGFTVDIRNAKLYYLQAKDRTGNTATTTLKVVANTPSDFLTNDGIGKSPSPLTAIPSTFSDTSGSGAVADTNEVHTIDFTLRDTYGNPIFTEPGIKEVEVELSFSNNVNLDQINNTGTGEAIQYGTGDFLSLDNITNFGNASTIDGNYIQNFSSYAPTSSGYIYTTPNNNIRINELNIDITASGGYSDVGEGNYNTGSIFGNPSGSNSFWDYIGYNYKFTPLAKINSTTSSGLILRDYENQFTANLNITNTSFNDVTNLIIDNIFDISLSGATNIYLNPFMSFQNYTGVTLPYTNYCEGYNKSNGSGSFFYYSTGTTINYPGSTINICDKSSSTNASGTPKLGSSNMAMRYPAITAPDTITDNISFKATPKVVIANIINFDLDYESEIYYTIDSKTIAYKSFRYEKIDNVNNDEIMINGIVNDSDNYYTVKTGSLINYVGEMTKAEIYMNIHRNVAAYQRISTSGDYNGVQYKNNGDLVINSTTFSASPSPHTFIADGFNIIIENDILEDTDNVLSIIAIKNGSGSGGNIIIDKDVQKIYSILVADKSIISGDGTDFYSDDRSAINQLYVKGSIISNNTIGGASELVPQCPYYITSTCDSQEAKRYDLNHFRQFVFESGSGSIDFTTSGINEQPGYDESPFIIEYDSRLKHDIPRIFRK